MQDYRRLRVWEAAHEMSVNIANALHLRFETKTPGLRSQILRAAQSIPSNIAEGCGKRTNPELARFLDISIASANEFEEHLLYARDTSQISDLTAEFFLGRVEAVRKMLFALLRRVEEQTAGHENAKKNFRNKLKSDTGNASPVTRYP